MEVDDDGRVAPEYTGRVLVVLNPFIRDSSEKNRSLKKNRNFGKCCSTANVLWIPLGIRFVPKGRNLLCYGDAKGRKSFQLPLFPPLYFMFLFSGLVLM